MVDMEDARVQLEYVRLEGEEDEGNLKVTVEEEKGSGVQDAPSFLLVGQLLTNRQIRAQLMKDETVDIWRPLKEVSIKVLENGLFLIQFFYHLDVKRIVKGGPWFFDKHMLILSMIPKGTSPHDVPLFEVSFWVQIHDLQPGFISKRVGKQLGDWINVFLEYDVNNNFGLWRSICV